MPHLAEARADSLHRAQTLEAAAEDAVGESVAEAQVARNLVVGSEWCTK